VLVKVNSVVIPGVNDGHLPEVAKAVRAAGAFMVNLVPLLSAPEHGTHFGLTGQRGPDAAELEAVQRACAVDARLMRHCRQCRADAVGRLGEDRFESFTLARLPPEPARDASELRAERRAAVERVRAVAARERDAVLVRLAGRGPAAPIRVAVASKSGGIVDQHFGHATEFLVYDVSRVGVQLVGRRAAGKSCAGGDADDDALEGTVRALSDCKAVLVARIGRCPEGQLAAAGIEASQAQAHRPIEAALLEWLEARADLPGPRMEVA
jgi:nitrogen fixation protein NifB